MAIVTLTNLICDRCGKEMLNDPWKKKLFGLKLIKIKMTRVNAIVPDPIGWHSTQYDICRECAEKLENWLNNPEVISDA